MSISATASSFLESSGVSERHLGGETLIFRIEEAWLRFTLLFPYVYFRAIAFRLSLVVFALEVYKISFPPLNCDIP